MNTKRLYITASTVAIIGGLQFAASPASAQCQVVSGGGTASSPQSGAVIECRGGLDPDGINNSAADDVTVEYFGDGSGIATTTDDSPGIVLGNNADINVTDDNRTTTQGANSDAIRVGDGSNVLIGGSIRTRGDNSRGIVAGNNAVIDVTDDSSVNTRGLDSDAINVGDGASIFIGGAATTEGDNSTAILAGNGASIEVTNDSTVSAVGANSYAIRTGNDADLTLGGITETTGMALDAVFVGENSTVDVQGRIRTQAMDANALVLNGGTSVNIASGALIRSDTGSGILANGDGNALDVQSNGNISGSRNGPTVDFTGSNNEVLVRAGGTIDGSESIAVRLAGTGNEVTVQGATQQVATAGTITAEGGQAILGSDTGSDTINVGGVVRGGTSMLATIDLRGGDDTLNINDGASIRGNGMPLGDGGAGIDTLNIQGDNTVNSSNYDNFENVNVGSGSTYNVDDPESNQNTTTTDGGTTNVNDGGSTDTNTADGGTVNVNDGGSSQNTNATNGGTANVNDGGTSENTTADNGGTANVNDGGSSTNTTANDGGTANVNDGGSSTNTTANDGGTVNVNEGGTSENTTANSGGTANVNDGGSSTNTSANDGGTANVNDGGSSQNTTASNGGTANVNSGGTSENTSADSGGTANVNEGGSSTNTTANDGGTVNVNEGGSSENTTANNGGTANVNEGGSSTNTSANDGGTANVNSGGSSENTSASNGGTANVNEGGSSTNTNAEDGGTVNVNEGGSSENTTASSGGTANINNGGQSTNSRADGGTVNVNEGADGGSLSSSNGGSVNVRSGASATVEDGATDSDGTINFEDGSSIDIEVEEGSFSQAEVRRIDGLTVGDDVRAIVSNSPFLTITAEDGSITISRDLDAFERAGVTSNQRSVGAALDAIDSDEGTFGEALVTRILFAVDDPDASLNTLTGEIYAANLFAGATNGAEFAKSLSYGSAWGDVAQDEGTRIWGGALGNDFDVEADVDELDIASSARGGAIGIDFEASSSGSSAFARIGIAGSYQELDTQIDAFDSTADSELLQVGIYALGGSDRFEFSAALTYGWLETDISRGFSDALGGGTGRSNLDGNILSAAAEAKFDLIAAGDDGGFALSPFATISATRIEYDAGDESGLDLFDLTLNESSYTSVVAGAGVELSNTFEFEGSTFVPALRVGYEKNLSDEFAVQTVNFRGDGNSTFEVASPEAFGDRLVVGAQAAINFGDTGPYLGARYTGSFGDRADNHAASIIVGFAF